MLTKHLVAIGASAGGIEPLRELVGLLPSDFPAAIAVVLHTSPRAPRVLHEILSRSGPLRAIDVHDDDRLDAGRIYVAPPDFHLLIEPGCLRVIKGSPGNPFRPGIDPLFRSAAQVFGPAAIGVVLSGNLDDGSAGLRAIRQLGGTTVVQDPDDALFPSMPRNAMHHARARYVLRIAQMAPLLVRLTRPSVMAPEVVSVQEPGNQIAC